jgi:hypothetical protein
MRANPAMAMRIVPVTALPCLLFANASLAGKGLSEG